MAIECIGIDIGYGFTKTCRSDNRHIFPTAVAMMAKEATFSETSPVVVNGHRFLVGKEAEREGNTIDTRQSGFVTVRRLARRPGPLPPEQWVPQRRNRAGRSSRNVFERV